MLFVNPSSDDLYCRSRMVRKFGSRVYASWIFTANSSLGVLSGRPNAFAAAEFPI